MPALRQFDLPPASGEPKHFLLPGLPDLTTAPGREYFICRDPIVNAHTAKDQGSAGTATEQAGLPLKRENNAPPASHMAAGSAKTAEDWEVLIRPGIQLHRPRLVDRGSGHGWKWALHSGMRSAHFWRFSRVRQAGPKSAKRKDIPGLRDSMIARSFDFSKGFGDLSVSSIEPGWMEKVCDSARVDRAFYCTCSHT